MGVQISGFSEPETIQFEALDGRTIAVDAMNTVYQFLSSIRQRDGTPLMDSKGKTTSHLSGLFYRTSNFIDAGIRPVYVFDGEPPKFKAETISERKKIRDEAREKWEKAKEKGDLAAARKYAMASSKIEPEMLPESKELLDAMGVPYVNPPSEGEAQSAYMAKKGDAWAAASQDWDSLLFGAPRLLRNLTVTGRRKVPGKDEYMEVQPELIDLDKFLENNNLNQQQLILIGLLIGNDFEPGIKGVGPKTALELVHKHKTLDKLMAAPEIGPRLKALKIVPEVEDLFKDPKVTDDYKLKWNPPDPEKITKILCDRHEFSPDRIENTLKKLEVASKSTQVKLESFF